MTATIRTLIYAGVAVLFAVGAYATHRSLQPPDLSGFDLVGQEFYPSFTKPEEAARLRVAAFDDLAEKAKVFTVEKHGDSWRIPSHHDYPAEAKKRLAETAASVMGITRIAVAGRQEAEHERYGVIDPLDEESPAIRGRGQRITLFDDAGKELVDFIVGNKVEGETNLYYVRRPSEKETYRAKLEVSLSTKFSDWIEPDLLKLSSSDLVALKSTKPIFEEKIVRTPLGQMMTEQQTGEDTVELSRKSSTDDWKLSDLDEANEEFDDSPVSSVVSAIDDLKIIGVRPKPRGIRADFTLDIPENLRQDPRGAQEFARERVRELMDKGFGIFADESGQPYLSAREGELVAATKDGVAYNLHFGNRFEGSLDDIEFGAASSEAKKPETDKKKEDATADGEEPKQGADGETDAADAGDDSVKQGRYVLVRVEFDPKYIGEEPVAPVEPKKPESPAAPEKPEAGAPSADEGNKGEESQTQPEQGTDEEKADNSPDTDDKPPADSKPPEKTPAELAYEEALKDYESLRLKHVSDKEDYDRKVEEGKKKVEQLNGRFQDWYYVISSESFETLRLSRSKLVQVKDFSEQPPVKAPVPGTTAPAEPNEE